ncbi:MAG: thioesterase domain-containing protein [Longimicrobiaceae bacterium]
MQPYRPPRTEAERRIAAIWAELLGMRQVGLGEPFFSLGGHSLLAYRVLSRVREEFGYAPPLAVRYSEWTVDALARAVTEHGGTEASDGSLVVLRAAGTRPPLFLVHAGDGHVLSYEPLVRALGDDQPVYGLKARGVEGGQAPHRRIEPMAEEYAQAVCAVQPTGPYLLCGWSTGGWIALEIARRLAARGETVGMLALIDARFAAETEDDDDAAFLASTLLVALYRYAPRYACRLEARQRLERELRVRPPAERVRHLLEEARRAGMVIPPGFGAGHVEALLRVRGALSQALRSYAPEPYTGDALYFRAEEHALPNAASAACVRCPLGTDRVRIVTVPGSHATIILEPSVHVVAAELSAGIRGAVG